MPEMNSTPIAKFQIRHLDINDYDDDAIERMMIPYKNLSNNIRLTMWNKKDDNQKVLKYSFNDNNYIVWTITKTKTTNTFNDKDYTVHFNVELVNEDDDCNMRLLYLDQVICEISNFLRSNAEACNQEIVADQAYN